MPTMYLENINTPDDLKKLDKASIPALAKEIREFLIKNLSNTGGHLASNLGVVDLTLVLHYLFNSPKDSFVFDVGHQAYTHKILTGRKDKFHTIRTMGGISGFPKRAESEHDIEETGHASTSISFALGLSTARKKQNIEGDVIAIIGDGAMTGGLALEAINNASHVDSDLIVIINNNEMSIGENIGVISKTLNMTLNNKLVQELLGKTKDIISLIPFGRLANEFMNRFEGAIRSFLTPGIMFREFGFKYFGPVDGHNYAELFETFENVKNSKGLRIVHVNTKKGLGYYFAEENPSKFHGIAPFDIATGEIKNKQDKKTFSSLVSESLCSIAEKNNKIVAITAAMEGGTGLSLFAKKYPRQFYDVGIAEAHATTFASGLSSSGLIPFVAIYSTFMQRAFDQVIHDVCLMNLNVKFLIDRVGLVPDDGDTHQGLFDVAFLRIIPSIVIFTPTSEKDFFSMVELSSEASGPFAIRYPKDYVLESKTKLYPDKIEIGKSYTVKKGDGQLLIISYGTTLHYIVEAIEELKINATVLNLVSIKPLDESAIINLAQTHKKILIVEEVLKAGGIGEAISSILTENKIKTEVYIHAVENKFIEVANRKELLSIYGLDSTGIKTKIKTVI